MIDKFALESWLTRGRVRVLKNLIVIGLFFGISASCQNDFYEPEIRSRSFDIILVIGQSNTLAGKVKTELEEYVAPGILQLGRHAENNLRIIPAKEPLDHHVSREHHIGFATTFAGLYQRDLLASGRQVLILPCAKPGTGFRSNHWGKNKILYNDAVQRVKYCLDSFPDSRLVAILWHQGENDEGFQKYQVALDSMIVSLRSEINADSVPFLLGGMVPYYVSQSSELQKIQKIIKDTRSRLQKTGYVDPEIPFVIEKENNAVDLRHYNADGQRELGRRYFQEFLLLQQTQKEEQ